MDGDQLLDGLDPDQRAAVVSPGAPLAILAGPGSGKTRVLTRRIAYRTMTGSADGRHVLALTFTRRAAAELTTRLRQLGQRDRLTVGTFHAVALGMLRQRAADTGRPPPAVLAERSRLIAALLDSARRGGPNVADAVAEVDWARARLVSPETYARAAVQAGRRPSGGIGSMAEIYHRYEEAKRKRKVLDLDDLLGHLADLIEADAQFADVQRWRFRHLFVDEFQDVNPLQLRLLQLWSSGRGDLCLVGDPDQSIYAWNGADPKALREVGVTFPGATVLRLGHNHRSSPQIVRAATSVLRDGVDDQRANAITATAPDGPRPSIYGYADELAEAAGIAALIDAGRVPGAPWSHSAVLVRTNAQVPAIIEGLGRAGIPARARRAGLADEPEVRAALAIGPPADAPFGVRDWLAEIDVADSERDDGASRGPVARGDKLVTVVDVARHVLIDEPAASLAQLRQHLDGQRGLNDAVDVVTFHAAKGLEWPTVIVAGCEAGLVPHASALHPEAKAEEARLLYVAMTRAGERLHLTWSASRAMPSGRVARQRSPLLDRIDLGEPDDPVAPPPTLHRPRSNATTHDDDVAVRLHALETWRTSAARVAQVMPSFVLPDRALASIANAAPSNEAELAAIGGIGPIAARRYGRRILEVLASVS